MLFYKKFLAGSALVLSMGGVVLAHEFHDGSEHQCAGPDPAADAADYFIAESPEVFESYADGSLPVPDAGDAGLAGVAGPIAHAATQPAGALTGRIVFMSAGHGWTYANGTESITRWFTQRGVNHEMNEDYGTLDQMNLFADYIFNAGGTVVAFRPLGYQTNEVVLDNVDAQVTWSGPWNNSAQTKYYGRPGEVPYRWASISSSQTATATYTPNIPQAGFYPVYTWVLHGIDRTRQLYRIRHSGGESHVRVPHDMVGNGWVYLGAYYFEAGSNPQTGSVVISNLSPTPSYGSVVIADAIRFGNGMGDVIPTPKSNEPTTVSGYPREEECSRYWVQRSMGVGQDHDIYDRPGLGDAGDNVGTPPRMAREMNRQQSGNLFKRVYIGFHSNASGGRGSIGLFNNENLFPGTATPNQYRLAQIVGREVNDQMVAMNPLLELNWHNRGNNVTLARSDFAFGEINNRSISSQFDATIIEVAFHDNLSDARLMRDPKARNWIARACYRAVLKYMYEFDVNDRPPMVFLPEPPRNVRARAAESGIEISWIPPQASAGSGAPTGYAVYRSSNGYGFGHPVQVSGGSTISVTLTDVPADTDLYFRVAAVNAGGESLPSATVGCRRPSEPDARRVLFVNAFTRFDRTTNLRQTPAPNNYRPPGNSGTMERVMPRANNSFDYVVQYGRALSAAGMAFDSCDKNAVLTGQVNLANYPIVLWQAGQDVTNTFNSFLQSRISAYRAGGGHLFVSGADIAWDLDRSSGPGSGDRAFLHNQLKARLATDAHNDSGSYTVAPASGSIFAGGPSGMFDDGARGIYWVQAPDVLTPMGDGTRPALNYIGGTGGPAAIQYDGSGGGGRVIYFGFPFETITGSAVRNAYMAAILEFLSEPRPPQITSQPQSRSVNRGANVTFSVSASGDPPLSYQWRFNGADIQGAVSTSISLSNVQGFNAGEYTVRVWNDVDETISEPAILTVNLPPTITAHPIDQTAVAGSEVVFTVEATGAEPMEYEWRFNGDKIDGPNESTLMLEDVQPDDAGLYSVVVRNVAGVVVSSNAMLTVIAGEPPHIGSISLLEDGRVMVMLAGETGATYVLETSADLFTWKELATVVMEEGSFEFIETPGDRQRFYRARLQK